MSANNGVYILKAGKQYRVARLSTIENLYCDKRGRYFDEMQPERIIEMFGACKFTTNAEQAINIALAINSESKTEYGVVIIDARQTWKQILSRERRVRDV